MTSFTKCHRPFDVQQFQYRITWAWELSLRTLRLLVLATSHGGFLLRQKKSKSKQKRNCLNWSSDWGSSFWKQCLPQRLTPERHLRFYMEQWWTKPLPTSLGLGWLLLLQKSIRFLALDICVALSCKSLNEQMGIQSTSDEPFVIVASICSTFTLFDFWSYGLCSPCAWFHMRLRELFCDVQMNSGHERPV